MVCCCCSFVCWCHAVTSSFDKWKIDNLHGLVEIGSHILDHEEMLGGAPELFWIFYFCAW